MAELVWTSLARADLLNIVDFISDDNLAAAQRLKEDIENKAVRLLDFPELGRPGRVDGTRELVVSNNYILIYQAHPDVICILRVLHAALRWPHAL